MYGKSYLQILGSLILVAHLSACTSLLAPDRPYEPEPGFRRHMAPANQALPVPVEIAQDIAEITENGAIYFKPPQDSLKFEDQPKVQESETVNESAVPTEKVATEAPPQPSDSVVGSSGPLGKALRKKRSGPLGIAQLKGQAKMSADGKTMTYIVKLGDTLMKIAFEKYGDYLRWREIYEVNKSKMTHWTKMKVGTELTIENVRYVYIRRKGKPYLIRKGDTLKSIAKNIYGSTDKWRQIWENNPQLIRNPKKIYAGFTLYYEPSKKGLEIRSPSNKDSGPTSH